MRMRISGRRWHKFVSRTIFDSMVVQDYAEQRTIPAALLRASFSRLNPLKPCQNQARLRPDGNKPRMPNDTDLAMVIAHRCKLQSSHARFPKIGLDHFGK